MSEDLREIVANALGVLPNRVADDMSPKTVANWDSLATVKLFVALEERFGLELSLDEMAELTNIGAIRRLLIAKGIDA